MARNTAGRPGPHTSCGARPTSGAAFIHRRRSLTMTKLASTSQTYDAAPATSPRSGPGEEQGRIRKQCTDIGDELRAQLTIDDAMVEGQRQLRHLANREL